MALSFSPFVLYYSIYQKREKHTVRQVPHDKTQLVSGVPIRNTDDHRHDWSPGGWKMQLLSGFVSLRDNVYIGIRRYTSEYTG